MKRFIVTAFSLCFVFMFVSCRQGEHVDAHHHDAEPMTRYNNDLELYAELPPLIVGEQATISVFLTALDNHKPFVGENVVLELSVNGKTQTVEPNHSHTQGVYTCCYPCRRWLRFAFGSDSDGRYNLPYGFKPSTRFCQP